MQKKFINQFKKFVIVGFGSTSLNYITYSVLYYISGLIIFSSAIGYLIGLSNSYFFGLKWVFKTTDKKFKQTIIKFLIVYIIGGIFNSLTIYLLKRFNINYSILWILGNGIALMNNFLGSKFIVFRNN